jgi:fused signal recognition particle receptor
VASGFFSNLKNKLGKARTGLTGNILAVITGRSKIDDAVFEELEEVLIQADLGVETSINIVEEMKTYAHENKTDDPVELIAFLKKNLLEILKNCNTEMDWKTEGGTHITLIAGVNGSGKTTTTGKLAAKLKADGSSVMLGAADTFRAAAVEQLTTWSERADVPLIKHQEGADPAAVAYDATDSAVSKKIDNLLIDTAGRLHTKVNLMEELQKIHRVIGKRLPGAPHEVLLVLDATTGQNALQQAKYFTEILKVTGIVLTKLDGTAKGGIVVAIQQQLGIPIKYIGVGEGIDDLQPFNPEEFVEALFGET